MTPLKTVARSSNGIANNYFKISVN